MKLKTRLIHMTLLGALIASGTMSGLLLTTTRVSAQELPLAKKIELLTKNKDQIGTGDMLRRFFFGDLLPISVQPGGAGI